MENRTQMVIGVASLGVIAVLFLMPQSKSRKLEDQQSEIKPKPPKQEAAVPQKKTPATSVPKVESDKVENVAVREKQPALETEAAPEPLPDLAESKTSEDDKGPKEKNPSLEESEAHINPVLALVDKIDDAAGKIRVLSTLAGSLARTGDNEQATAILAQAEELIKTIEADTDLPISLGYIASAKLHTGETDIAKQMLEKALDTVIIMESKEAKMGALEQLARALSPFREIAELDKINTKLATLRKELENNSHPILSLTAKIQTPEEKVRVLTLLAGALAQSGDQEQSANILKQVQEIIEPIEESPQKISAQGFYAGAQIKLGERESAIKLLEAIVVDIERLNEAGTKVAAIEKLARTLNEFHDDEKIQTFITDIKSRARELTHGSDPILNVISKIESPEGRVRVLCNLCGTLAEAGGNKQAIAILAKAQEIIVSIEDDVELAPSLSYLAVAQIKLGKTVDAKATLVTALSTVEKIKGIDSKVRAFGKLMTALHELGEKEQINTVIPQSLALAREIQQKAQLVLRQSLTLVENMENGEEKATVLQQIASAMSQPGNSKRAEEIFVQALTVATQISDAEKKALALEKIASTFAQTGPGGNFTQLQFSIGWMYYEGKNLPRNPVLAARWYRKAADHGHPQAQVNLGVMYNEGEGVPANNAEALNLFTQAAEQGHPQGQTALGMMLALGQSGDPDYVQATKWFTLAAGAGDDSAKQAQLELSKKMTPSEVAEGQKLAKAWQDKQARPEK